MLILEGVLAIGDKTPNKVCDNDSNFRGGENDIKLLLKAWNQGKIAKALTIRECDWIFNPPPR
ncbi:unnamed protein product [Mesocestoides corti]|uniref:Type II restriction endonuclease n=1 Tax=Mesocestoides corti TaxID=53468 RepID=A0A0R3UHJ4_MESCO|nr:unnamed protein product [Mesocestoides corti]